MYMQLEERAYVRERRLPPFQTVGIIFVMQSEQYPKKSWNLYENNNSSSELYLVKLFIHFKASG